MATLKDNKPLMTDRIFMDTIKRFPAGEYYYGDLTELYFEATPKSYRDTSKWQNSVRFHAFFHLLEQKKYGLSYLTHNRVEYIGVNDCNTLMVRW